jgi:3-hydroxyisobutyrate dehydrogenase
MQSVALLGLGTMGRGMASNLAKAGFPLSVYNRRSDVASRWMHENGLEQKVRIANHAAVAVQSADVVISMLADDDAARSVWLGVEGALSSARPGAILIKSSTVSPAWIEQLNAAAIAKQCHVLDAPVTGSKVQAANGDCFFWSEEMMTR